MLIKRINESEADFIINSNGVLSKYEGWDRNAVVIPDEVITIGEGAFKSHHELKSVKIGNNVKIIDDYAFYGCISLTSIIIPDSVTEIGWGAFKGCSNLSSINIPDSVTEIGWGAFKGCERLTSIDLPYSVTKIGDYAFNCNGLTSINIPDSVTSIGEGAFRGCAKCNVIIPNNILNFSYVIDGVKSINEIPIEDLCFIGNDQSTLILPEDEFVLTEINGNKCAIKYIVQDYSKNNGYLFAIYPDRTYEAFGLDLNSFTDGVRLIKVCGLYNDYPIGVRKDGKETFLSSEYRGQWFDDCDVDLDDNLYINGEKVN